MAQFTVRKLDDDVKARLQRRAARNGRSMEEEVREILRNAVRSGPEPLKLGTWAAQRFAGLGFTGELPELRGGEAEPASFRKR